MFHKKVVDVIIYFAVVAFSVVSSLTKEENSNSTLKSHKLLLISFDGFRWNYLSRINTPNFGWIKRNGVSATHGLKNAFITKTFPNHYTLVTGQWEENHGIIANYMYDPVLNEKFSPHDLKDQNSSAWFDDGGEPIWVTNQKQDGKSGVIMWVGGAAPVKNILPTKFMPFDTVTKNKTKVDTMIKWFKEDNVNLGLMYFRQPDLYGHYFGPESVQVTRMIGGLDELVGYLLRRLKEENLLDKLNVIITSDHGFSATPSGKEIYMDEILDPSTYSLGSSSPIAGIWPEFDYQEEIYKNLTLASKENGHFTVYLKENIPAHFHYTHNRRIPPIVVVADDHYSFIYDSTTYHQKGTHGYENSLQDMHPFFIAMGPSFKTGYHVDSFYSVDVYPLMCQILGVQPSPNNGSLDIVGQLLLDSQGAEWVRYVQKHQIGTIIVAVLVFIGIIGAAFIIISEYRRKKHLKSTRVVLDDIEQMAAESDPLKQLTSSAADTSRVPLLNDHDF